MNKFQNIFYLMLKKKYPHEKQSLKKTFLYSLSALIIVYSVSIILTILFKPDYQYPDINRPVIFFLKIIITSVLEELVFRLILPEGLIKLGKTIIKNEKIRLFYNLFVEISVITLFAVLHVYLGLGGIINSIFAAIIFRLLFLYTGHIASCCFTHLIYNLIQGIILMLQVFL